MNIFQKSISFIFIAGFFTGCATQRVNQEINPQILAKPSTIVIAQLSGMEEPHYYKEGEQGLLDLAISAMMTDSIVKRIQEINVTPILTEQYYNTFKTAFESRAFGVKIVPFVLDKKDMQSFSKNEEAYAPYDFLFLRNKYNVEYALILDPQIFGVKRSYYGFIPTSAPCGYANVKIYLINLNYNSIVGHYNGLVEMPVTGDWDTPPEYFDLVTASKNSLIKVLNDAHTYFFGKSSSLPPKYLEIG